MATAAQKVVNIVRTPRKRAELVGEIDRLAAHFAVPEKPGYLRSAEAALRAAREKRAGVREELLQVMAEAATQSIHSPTGRAVAAAQAQMEAAEIAVGHARKRQNEAREAFAPDLLKHAMAVDVEVCDVANEIIGLLDRLLGPMADYAAFAEINSLPTPRAARGAVLARSHLNAIRAAINNGS